MKYILLFFLSIFVLDISCIQVSFDIKPKRNFCIGENITENTVAIFSVEDKTGSEMFIDSIKIHSEIFFRNM